MGDAPSDSFERPMMYVGRYAIFSAIARGGFASVHLARSFGAGGFARTVAIKRLHRQYAQDPEVSAMFLDEAHLVARIRHPNVIPTLDLIAADDELMIVMEYVEGVTLRYLLHQARERKRKVPLGVVLRTMVGVLRGLHAAHEARNEQGEHLGVIHRDVTPDNILIGTDGLVRLLDFGVAKALGQYHDTQQGEMRGKLAYMTPEQVNDEELTRRSDIFSAAIVLWEAMTNERLFAAKSVTGTAHRVLTREIPLPSALADTPKKLDGIVLQGLERDANKRWPTAERFAAALEAVGTLATEQSMAQYVRKAGAERIRERAGHVQRVEAGEIDTSQLDFPSRASMTANEIRAAVRAPPSRPSPAVAIPPPPPTPTGPEASPPLPPTSDAPTSIPSEPNGWSELPRPSRAGAQRAVLPVLAALLMAVIGVLLLTGDDEPDARRPDVTTTARPAALPPTDEPTAAPRPPAPAPPATVTPAVEPTPAPSAPSPQPSPPPKLQPPGPVQPPRPLPSPRTLPSPRPPSPKTPPPLYGRD